MGKGIPKGRDTKISRPYAGFVIDKTVEFQKSLILRLQVFYVRKSKLYIQTYMIDIFSFHKGFNRPCSSTGFYCKSIVFMKCKNVMFF